MFSWRYVLFARSLIRVSVFACRKCYKAIRISVNYLDPLRRFVSAHMQRVLHSS